MTLRSMWQRLNICQQGKARPLPMNVNGYELKNVEHFKYLGSVIDRDGTIDRDVSCTFVFYL